MADAVAPPRPPHHSDIPPVVALWPGDDGSSVNALRDVLAAADGAPIVVPAGDRLTADLPPDRRARITAGPSTGGIAGFLNAVAADNPRADVVLVAGDVALPEGWLAALAAAAMADDAIAAASALLSGDVDSLLDAGAGRPARMSSALTSGTASPTPPRVLAATFGATWIRRSALDLIGDFDQSLRHPDAVLGEFSARALRRGLACVLADGAIVLRSGNHHERWPAAERAELVQRHPWEQGTLDDLEAADASPLRRSLIAARAAQRGLSVTIDARALGPGVGGTQTYVGALLMALGEVQDISVRAVLAHDAPSELRAALAAVGVESIDYEQAAAGVPRTDVVHRPQQVFTPHDLRLLQMLGERIVVSHMDLISFRTPAYHATLSQWHDYRRVTRLALAAADRVLFFSDHARRDAIGEALVTTERSAIVGIGLHAPTDEASDDGHRPAGVPPGREFLLALGADYAHKNRPFALRLVNELRVRHGWDGMLVLAGAHVAHGSSLEEERDELSRLPELAPHVVDLGRVSNDEKRWLLRNAVAHLCASNYEGFGLAPLEAATVSRPCIYAAWTSLGEIIDPAAATIVPWDPQASADAAIALLTDGPARERHLACLRAALERYTWHAVVSRLVEAYRAAVASPFRASAPRAWEELQREEQMVALEAARIDLERRVAHGLPLIDGLSPMLTREQQRGLMRVASRRWLRGTVLAPFGLLGIDDHEPPAET